MSITSGNPLETLSLADVRVGLDLPPLVVEVTRSLIIAGALFTNDAQDIHHDRDWAQKRGFKDIFMNTSTALALFTRYVSDWAGPEAVVEHFAFRMERQQYPDDDLRFTGTVKAIEPGSPRGRVTVDVVGKNGGGTYVAATVRLSLPAAKA